MKQIYPLLILLFFSCKTQTNYELYILENGVVDKTFVSKMDEPSRMLLGWHLFAFGNECDGKNNKPKCEILNQLGIEDECEETYIRSLKQWFEGDIYRKMKLNNCPSLPTKGAIQNEFKYIFLKRNQDTLTIHIRVDGLNNAQEKSWNAEQEDRFLIVGEHLKLL